MRRDALDNTLSPRGSGQGEGEAHGIAGAIAPEDFGLRTFGRGRALCAPLTPALSREGRGSRRPYPFVLLALIALTGCDMLDMYDQPHKEPLEASAFFANGMSARPLVPGTVARGQLREDDAFYTGSVDGKYVEELPIPLTQALLERGRDRFDIYCSMCHGPTGRGDGIIVQRGFQQPPSYHTDHLRNAPVGHFYDVITNGYRTMMPYNVQVEPRDRWAIVAYIRVLQVSQNGTLEDVPAEDRPQLEGAPE